MIPVSEFVAAFARQAAYCRQREAWLTAAIIDAAALDIEEGGALARLVENFGEDPGKGALALRIAGAAYYLALTGEAGGLQNCYVAPFAAPAIADMRAQLSALAHSHRQVFENYISRPPQTNVAGRAAALLPGFRIIARETGLPLDLYELGASGGLLLAFDQYRVDYGAFACGESDLVLSSEWRGSTAFPQGDVKVDNRFGCDRNPVDFSDPEQRVLMHSYIWPEHPERQDAFDSAIAIFNKVNAEVEKADALDWLRGKLGVRRAGAASVFFHSVFAVYLGDNGRAQLQAMMEAAGRMAKAEAPLAWLRFEPEEEGAAVSFNIDLTLWPGGETRRLAKAHPHGEWVEPLSI